MVTMQLFLVANSMNYTDKIVLSCHQTFKQKSVDGYCYSSESTVRTSAVDQTCLSSSSSLHFKISRQIFFRRGRSVISRSHKFFPQTCSTRESWKEPILLTPSFECWAQSSHEPSKIGLLGYYEPGHEVWSFKSSKIRPSDKVLNHIKVFSSTWLWTLPPTAFVKSIA